MQAKMISGIVIGLVSGIIGGAAQADNLPAQIDSSEKAGLLNHEQANQLRADDAAITRKEDSSIRHHHGTLTAKNEHKFNKKRSMLSTKLNNVETLKQDNSGKNLGDGRLGAVTPEVQSEKMGDIRLAARLRKMVVDDKTLSFNAKNIKMVAINGTITLRGVVNNPEEKNLIGTLATQCAGSGNVLNELQIK